jgi:hypothetical protein
MRTFTILPLLALGAIACGSALFADPRDAMRLTAYRVPAAASPAGIACARQCADSFDSCPASFGETGDTMEMSVAEECNNRAVQCFSGCPEVSTSEAPQGAVLTADSGRQTCNAGLDAQAGTYCFFWDPAVTNRPGMTFEP